MSLVWRSLPASALVAGSILLSASGCKSGGGWWSPGSSKWGSTESSTSDLAVSRPPTRVPTPSSGATPTTANGLASARGTTGAQDGPYGTSAGGASAGSSGYGTQPAGWQSEPHSSVAPAGGYETGGPYGMASTAQPQPGVTPGAYSQPYTQGAYADDRVADAGNQPYGQSEANAGGYGAADAAGSAVPANDAGSIYQDAGPPSGYAFPDASATYGAPPASDAAGAMTDPAAAAAGTPLYDPATTYEGPDAANPAGAMTAPPTQEAIANPYSLSSSTRPPTSPTPTTSPSNSTAPFDPPTLPSSLSSTPGSYRPGSTAAPGSIYGTGYDTADGTVMR